MGHNKVSIVVIGVALGLASSVALAQRQPREPVDPGFYAGASLGAGLVQFSDSFAGINTTARTTLSKDETDTAWKLFGGYRIHRNIAVEGGYTDFGKFTATRSIVSGAGSLTHSIKISGWHVQAMGVLPLRNFDLFAKVGGIYATVEAEKSVTGGVTLPANADRNPKNSSLALLSGIGAGYNFTKNFSIRLELEVTSKVGNGTTGEGSVAMFSGGGVFKF
jgi:OOP family OmpA-OmpF porin